MKTGLQTAQDLNRLKPGLHTFCGLSPVEAIRLPVHSNAHPQSGQKVESFLALRVCMDYQNY
jgi:hypothetical protein